MIEEAVINAAREAEKRARARAEALSHDPAVKAAIREANAKTRAMAKEKHPKKKA